MRSQRRDRAPAGHGCRARRWSLLSGGFRDEGWRCGSGDLVELGPDATGGTAPARVRSDMDRKRRKHSALELERDPERPAVPAKGEGLLEPVDFGDPGMGRDIGLERVPGERADQEVSGLAPDRGIAAAREAEASDLINVGTATTQSLFEEGWPAFIRRDRDGAEAIKG